MVGHDGDAGVDKTAKIFGIEVRRRNRADQTLFLEFHEISRGIDHSGDFIVPPVELNHIEALHAEAGERARDDALDVGAVDVREILEVGDELGMNLRKAQTCGTA